MGGFCGKAVIVKSVPKFTADFCIDCHSHIQSSATVPLPLFYHQNGIADAIKPSRSFVDFLAPKLFGNGGRVSTYKTEQIADVLIKDLSLAYRWGSKIQNAKPYISALTDQQKAEIIFGNKLHIFTPVIIMPMDMDYAHIAGFPPESSAIYHEEENDTISMVEVMPGENMDGAVYLDGKYCKPKKTGTVERVVYYSRKKAADSEKKGDAVDVSHEKPNRVWAYQHYKKQHKDTVESVKKYPWQLIPMFHYDPRRWRNDSGGFFDKRDWTQGPWDKPFEFIATKSSKRSESEGEKDTQKKPSSHAKKKM